MGTLMNVFALLADQESEDVPTIAGLKTAEKNKNVKAKNKNKNKNNKKNSARDGEKGKEGYGHDQRSVGGNVANQRYNGHQRDGRSYGNANGSGNHYGQGDRPIYNSYWKVKGNAGDGQANGSVVHNGHADGFLKDGERMTNDHQNDNRPRNRRSRVTEIGADQEFENDDGGNQKQEAVNSPVDEELKGSQCDNQKQKAVNSPVDEEVKGSQCDNQEHEAVNHHGNEDQREVSVGTEVLSKKELYEKTKRAKEEAEREQRRLAREEERKKEAAMKTLKEYEEQKAKEKQKADEATSSVPETRVRGVTLDKELESMQVLSKEKKDNIYTKQNSKKETVKKDSNIDKDAKLHKTMSIEEFMKLPTGSEVQGGKGSDIGEYSIKNTNGGGSGRGSGVSRNYVNSNRGGTGRGRSNPRYFRNYENENRGGFGRSRNGDYRNNVNASPGGIGRGSGGAPDLSEITSFPVLAKATTPKKDL